MATKYCCFRSKLPILKQVISSNIVRAIEHGTFEDTASARILQATIVWHDEMLHHEQYTGESPAMIPAIHPASTLQCSLFHLRLNSMMTISSSHLNNPGTGKL